MSEEQNPQRRFMTTEQLEEAFQRFDRQYFSGVLTEDGWKVTAEGNWNCMHGVVIDEKRIILVRMQAHRNDDEVAATLIHEMAHALLPREVGHGDRWVAEMIRLRAAGAPTDPLDFIPNYDKNRLLVTSFIDAARSGASWEEAANCLFEDDIEPEVYSACRHFFDLERRTPYATTAP